MIYLPANIIIDLPRIIRFLILGILSFLISSSVIYGQGLIIRSGAIVINTGKLILKNDLINEGTYSDNSGTLFFSGVTQSIGGTTASKFNNLTVASGSTTTISAAGQTLAGKLLCNGTINSNGGLTLLSTSSGTALIDGSGTGQVLGDVTMQRYLSSGFGYKYFSSPFQASPVSEFANDMNLSSFTFYRYNENRTVSGWVSYNTSTNILNPLDGYAVNFGSGTAANTVDITGIVNNGNFSATLYNHNYTYTKGFNLIGNPYPSPIDWDAVKLYNTGIDDAVYYFKASTTDQYGGTYSTCINGISSDGISNNIIPSMQGFFVHVSDGSYPVTGTLVMDNSVRITDFAHPFAAKKSGFVTSSATLNINTTQTPLLRLTAMFSDDVFSLDPMVIYFTEKGTPEFNKKSDALKLLNTDLKVPNIYALSQDGLKLSIKALPHISGDLCKVPLGIKNNRTGTGNIIIKIMDIDESLKSMRIYLSDIVAGIDQDLLPGKEYSVSLAKGEFNDRFFLNLSKSLDVITGDQHEIIKPDPICIYSSHGIIKAEINTVSGNTGELGIYNLAGQLLFTEKIHDPGQYEFRTRLADGMYIVSYVSGTFRSSKKLFIQY